MNSSVLHEPVGERRRMRLRIRSTAHQLQNHSRPSKFEKGDVMSVNLSLAPLIALIAGILILIMPRLLNYIVAIYLIVIGLIGLFGTSNLFR
jgi:hypothetical protein